jgi:hypothetical protein
MTRLGQKPWDEDDTGQQVVPKQKSSDEEGCLGRGETEKEVILWGAIYLLICSLFNDAFSVSQDYSVEWKGDIWMMSLKNVEGSGRGEAFAWKDRGKPRKISVSIAGLRSEIWTLDFPNMKQNC